MADLGLDPGQVRESLQRRRQHPDGAGRALSQQGLGAWVVYNTGAYRQFLQRGGELPFLGSFHNGGVARREGLAHVQRGEPIGAPTINVRFSGDAEWLRDFVQVEIEQHGHTDRRLARARR